MFTGAKTSEKPAFDEKNATQFKKPLAVGGTGP